MKTRILAIVGSAIGLAAIGTAGYAVWPDHDADIEMIGNPVPLTSGVNWELDAQTEHSPSLHDRDIRLCLDLKVAGRQTAGGCEFDNRPSYGYYAIGPGPKNTSYILGPVPPAAVAVRLSCPGHKDRQISTSPLPKFQGVPEGRYYVAEIEPDSGVSAKPFPAGTSNRTSPPGFELTGKTWTITPLDSTGGPVEFVDF